MAYPLRRYLSAALAVVTVTFATGATAQTAQAELGPWGIEIDGISKTVDPGDDFYTYVNEGWLKRAEIPTGYPYNSTLVEAVIRTNQRLAAIISDIADSSPADGTPEQQIRDLYLSYLDVEKQDELGLEPIRADLDAIWALKDKSGLARVFSGHFTPTFFEAGAGTDPGNPERRLVTVRQSGLRLSSREVYLDDTENFRKNRAAYLDYIEATFDRAGIGQARARAEFILALETEIARAQWTKAEGRDPVRMYHPMSVAELKEYAPGFDWSAYLDAAGYADQSELVINHDTAIQKLAALFGSVPLEGWQTWLAFRTIDKWAPFLSRDWQQAAFDYSSIASGVTEMMPIEERAVNLVAQNAPAGFLSDSVGRFYRDRYFPAEYGEELETLLDYMRRAFRARLQKVAWMDDATRAEAENKINSILLMVGGTQTYKDYSSVRILPDDLVGNMRRLAAFEDSYWQTKLREPVNRSDWPWAAQTVNAGYDPSENRVLFPAGILQSPYYDPNADPAVNFGAITAVIGHEVGHAFDDQGSQYDQIGKLRNWWTEEARAGFDEQADRLVEQYNHYAPVEGHYVNGRLTLGENIGDHAGVAAAFDAYRLYVDEVQGGKAPVIDGFTGNQRFFMGWAQAWRNKMLEPMALTALLIDNHSPSKFRTNGVMRNTDAWYEAFDVKPGDELYLPPEERVHMW